MAVKDIAKYLKGNDKKVELKETELNDSDYVLYIKKRIENTFDISLSNEETELLKAVINGQGQEKDKITSAYSSSLQSFLIFRKVSEDNPITVNKIKYTKVEFEVENSVIGYKSSVDVKLSNDEGNVLFIESKLYEVVRDSMPKGKGKLEVGPSYFSNHESGYRKKLNFEIGDLREIGIEFPLEKEMYGISASKIKKAIVETCKQKDGYSKIDAIDCNEWVYSYGIKQILSHVIGILNYREQKEHKGEKIRFAYIYNKLPGYAKEEKNAMKKIDNYDHHVGKVYDRLKETLKENPLDCFSSTYQKIFKENEKEKYFNEIGDRVCEYYKLNVPSNSV